MNEKDTKVPVYIAIIVAIILIAAAGFYFLEGPREKAAPGEQPPAVKPQETPVATAPSAAITPSATPKVSVGTIKCDLCHTESEKLSLHINGGKLCGNCHPSQVHPKDAKGVHVGAGTVDLTCDSCHGTPPKTPVLAKGEGPGHYSVCEQCHAPPPDSLKPSNGNLVIIHLSRGKDCTTCHVTDVGAIHEKALANTTKK
jgi:hypothetical protein